MSDEFKIGQAADFFGISADSLRHYEREGLLAPSKVSANGYRSYSFEDAIRLNYIRVLRALEFGLDDIGDFIDRADLPGQKTLLERHEAGIELRLRELERLRGEIRGYIKGIEEVRRLQGAFEIIDSPAFAYPASLLDAEDLFTVRSREKYFNDERITGATYSLLVARPVFEGAPLADNVKPLCSGIWTGPFDETPPEGLVIMRSRRCLHSVFASRVRVSKPQLEPVIRYCESNGLSPDGDALCQYLAFEKSDDGFIDFVDIWIPIKS